MGEMKREPGLGWRRKKGSKQQGPVQVCNHFPLPLLYCSLWTDMLLLHPKKTLLYMLLVCVDDLKCQPEAHNPPSRGWVFSRFHQAFEFQGSSEPFQCGIPSDSI